MTVYQTARFQVQKVELAEYITAIGEFVAYVRKNEIHENSEAVKRFTDSLYPRLVAPVEFTEYFLLASSRHTP